ncbi:MAG: hypothetical protein QME40_07925 [bacterium]|nr:hypothetical protein [bacterium]
MFKKLGLFSSVVLISLTINLHNTFGISFPKSVGWVNDFAGVISKDYEDRLNDLITDLEKKLVLKLL